MGWTGITLGWEVSHSTLKQITINNFPQLSLLCLLFAHILDFNQPLLRDTKALPLMGPLSRHAVISNPSDYRWNVWRKFLYFLFKKERFLQPLRFLKPSGMRCGQHLMKGVNEWLDGFFKDHYRVCFIMSWDIFGQKGLNQDHCGDTYVGIVLSGWLFTGRVQVYKYWG